MQQFRQFSQQCHLVVFVLFVYFLFLGLLRKSRCDLRMSDLRESIKKMYFIQTIELEAKHPEPGVVIVFVPQTVF